ncbi:hypothetical protein ACFL2O_05280 [Thermodesulfobacteriota bacterium]
MEEIKKLDLVELHHEGHEDKIKREPRIKTNEHEKNKNILAQRH